MSPCVLDSIHGHARSAMDRGALVKVLHDAGAGTRLKPAQGIGQRCGKAPVGAPVDAPVLLQMAGCRAV